MTVFRKVLIANRGEITVRVARTCRAMGIPTVAVFSEADCGALHVRECDEAVAIGPAEASRSYLNVDALVDAARRTGADAVHPGYGFLSQNGAFADALRDAGVVFVGPPGDVHRRMGDKKGARRLMASAGVPVVPGYDGDDQQDATLVAEAARIGWPVMIKPSRGGGGKGMRVVRGADEFLPALQASRREAAAAFGDDVVVIERFVERPRHVEVQVLADTHGRVLHLFERECSIQRRHQKVVEESPSPFLTGELRARMGALAVALVKRIGYRNAGTLEFLVDENREPYFLEMNTRIQVEHPVTEMVTGRDLVQLQIRIAQGEPLPFAQADLEQRGHAIECRIYAEDPERGFLPSPGRLVAIRAPGGPGVREDSGVYEGFEVPIHYDSMLSKLIVHGATRPEAIARMRRALSEYTILGVRTTLPFLDRVMRHPAFVAGDFDTSFVDRLTAQSETADVEDPWRIGVAAAAIRCLEDRRAARAAPEAAAEGGSAWTRAGWRGQVGSRL